MSKKQLEKAAMIGLISPRDVPGKATIDGGDQGGLDRPTPEVQKLDSSRLPLASKPKTAPGLMAGFVANQSEAIREAELLREKLAEYQGSKPSLYIDPKRIRVSPWANRSKESFEEADFERFKLEIQDSGGNVQPIKVRKIAGRTSSFASGDDNQVDPEFEIVFGHRRHRACLELGIQVLAFVDDVSDLELFVEMDRENRERKNLAPIEQGQMYAKALDLGLFPSNSKLAKAIGRDLGDVGKALSLARLPRHVIEAFQSPLDLQYRWAKPLNDKCQEDPKGVAQTSKQLKEINSKLKPKEIFDALITSTEGVGPSNPQQLVVIDVGGVSVASLIRNRKGNVHIRLNVPIDSTKQAQLEEFLRAILKS